MEPSMTASAVPKDTARMALWRRGAGRPSGGCTFIRTLAHDWICIQYPHARLEHRQAERRKWPVHSLLALRVWTHPPLSSTYLGRVRRVGSATRECGATTAMLQVRSEKMHGTHRPNDRPAWV